MIAVPRENGEVAVHSSLQCHAIHKALKRALQLNDRQAQVVQAETGGGFGGKEEYPSIIALHAALLALKCGKPVRMIYDRHEDLAATTKRHPAVVTHRTGVKLDGTITAQEIEVVMDGGAYCTLTPVVLSRGAIHAGGPAAAARTSGSGRGQRARTHHRTARSAGSVRHRRSSPRRSRSAGWPRRSAWATLEIRRRNLYRVGDSTPTGQVLRESRGRVGRARTGSRGSRVRRRPGPDVAGPGATGRLRLPPRRPASVGPGPRRVQDRDRAGVARRRVHRVG